MVSICAFGQHTNQTLSVRSVSTVCKVTLVILQALHWQFGLSRVYGHSSRLPVVAEHFPPSAGQHSGTLLQPTVSCGRSATRYRIASLRVCVCVCLCTCTFRLALCLGSALHRPKTLRTARCFIVQLLHLFLHHLDKCTVAASGVYKTSAFA